jgi:nickel and cobalt resistance protein CnrR
VRPALRRLLVLAAVAFLAALAGVLIGRGLSQRAPEQSSALHELLHEELGLDAQQLVQIEQLEATFAARRGALEAEIRAENARLAAAIQAERGYGPRVTAEIERSHQIMGELQKATLEHIFAMRTVLRPDQVEKFDGAVVRALTTEAE